MIALAVVSAILLVVRLWAANQVGFGDSEALYASYAAHPQPAYLDHPGLIGIVARTIGEGAVPSPSRVHVITSLVSCAVPWILYGVARAAGAEKKHALTAGLVFAVVPEIAVGLFALTPDLLLAPAWLATVGCAIAGLRAAPGTMRSAGFLLAAGLAAGIAAAAKVSGLLLVIALAATYVSVLRLKGDASRVARSIWPWAGLVAGLIVFVPVVLYETRVGFPMLRHRFVETQTGAGLALTNIGALAGGQLLYLSPIVAWLAILAARDLVRQRNEDTTSRLLFFTFAIPLVPLIILCIWSHVAEPHWLAPALLALPIHAARRALGTRRIVIAAIGVAGLFTLLAHAWVLVPASARLFPESSDPKIDIASELYGWPMALDGVKEQMSAAGTPADPEGREVVVVGPHWTVCAQLHAGLPGIRVGCATPIPDDFDRWLPRNEWRKAHDVLFVTDNRFGGDGGEQLPAHVRVTQGRVRVMRGGRVARIFEMYLYSRRASSVLSPQSSVLSVLGVLRSAFTPEVPNLLNEPRSSDEPRRRGRLESKWDQLSLELRTED